MHIILIGPPATGKGTQAAILSKYFKITHISIGDIFRKHLKEKTTLGKKINFYIEKGLLVPDEISNDMIVQSLLDKSNQNGFILDGFPRNSQQAVFLSKIFEQHNMTLTKVIYFNSNEKLLKNRIIGRIICPKCGEIYHQENKLPQKNGFCDNDNTALIKRKDDSIETFNKRLSVYKQETFPLIEYYKNKILEIQVNDLNTSINDITKIILKKL